MLQGSFCVQLAERRHLNLGPVCSLLRGNDETSRLLDLRSCLDGPAASGAKRLAFPVCCSRLRF